MWAWREEVRRARVVDTICIFVLVGSADSLFAEGGGRTAKDAGAYDEDRFWDGLLVH